MGSFCTFDKAWVGKCGKLMPCAEHKDLKCVSCGEPATHQCGETGQFVCGALLCDDCEHTIYPSGTNGGIGFIQEPLPKGMKQHVRKSEQRYKPWYEHKEPTHPLGTIERRFVDVTIKAMKARWPSMGVSVVPHDGIHDVLYAECTATEGAYIQQFVDGVLTGLRLVG